MTTEQEYIDISDLQKIYNAYSILQDIVPEILSVISLEEYRHMMLAISELRDRYFERKLITEEDI